MPRLNSKWKHKRSKQTYELVELQPLVTNRHGDLIQPIILKRASAKYPVSCTLDELEKSYDEVSAP